MAFFDTLTIMSPLVRFYFCYILINDLPNCCKKLSFRNFADDTYVFYTNDKFNHLETVTNEESKLVFEYCIINNLSINLGKTNFILILSARSSGNIILVHNIECKSQIKYVQSWPKIMAQLTTFT